MNSRLKKLDAAIMAYRAMLQPSTAFVLEDGSTFTTELDAFGYLLLHGVETPQGRIVSFVHSTDNLDPLTASIYEEIDAAIQRGGLQDVLKELEAAHDQRRTCNADPARGA